MSWLRLESSTVILSKAPAATSAEIESKKRWPSVGDMTRGAKTKNVKGRRLVRATSKLNGKNQNIIRNRHKGPAKALFLPVTATERRCCFRELVAALGYSCGLRLQL